MLTEIEKYRLYFKYVSVQYGLKHWFHIDFKYSPNKKRNWIKDEIIGYELKYLWGDLPEPVSFKEFCNAGENINIGKNWDKYGYAQQKWVNYNHHTIQHWCMVENKKLWEN